MGVTFTFVAFVGATFTRGCLVHTSTLVVGCRLGALLLLAGAGQAVRVAEFPPQQELHLGVDASQIVCGPPTQRVQDLGVQTQEECLPFAHV